jgi:hypothetical protein
MHANQTNMLEQLLSMQVHSRYVKIRLSVLFYTLKQS